MLNFEGQATPDKHDLVISFLISLIHSRITYAIFLANSLIHLPVKTFRISRSELRGVSIQSPRLALKHH